MVKRGTSLIIGTLVILLLSTISCGISTPVEDEEINNYNEINTNQKYVFIEDATAGWCENCPIVSEILYDLYESGQYPFYFVSMVEDESQKAYDRLHDEYNIYAFPTCFFDGGYQLILGAAKPVSAFTDAINDSLSRDAPEISFDLDVAWNPAEKQLTTTVVVNNNETDTYTGNLRVFITEIVSRWFDYDGKPYHYAFIDYAINQSISIPGKDYEVFEEIWDANNAGFGDVDPNNLMVYAVAFNSEANTQYSDPPINNHPFDAYYADNAAEIRVQYGNLPPAVGISNPKQGKFHFMGNPLFSGFLLNTILLGKTNIIVNASDDSSVDHVELYIDGELKTDFTEEPYEWLWDELAIGKRTIEVTAYDDKGKNTTASMDVISFII